MDDYFSVTVGETEHKLFMSAAKQNRAVAIVRPLDDLGAIFTDTKVQEDLIMLFLRPVTKAESLDDLEMSTDQAEALVEWISEFIIDFFTKGLLKTKKAGERLLAASSTPSSNGSKA